MRRPNKKFVRREETEQHRINGKISARTIRLVREGQEPKIMATSEALKLAEAEDLDLVEISPKADPPVCKIMDYKSSCTTKRKSKKS